VLALASTPRHVQKYVWTFLVVELFYDTGRCTRFARTSRIARYTERVGPQLLYLLDVRPLVCRALELPESIYPGLRGQKERDSFLWTLG